MKPLEVKTSPGTGSQVWHLFHPDAFALTLVALISKSLILHGFHLDASTTPALFTRDLELAILPVKQKFVLWRVQSAVKCIPEQMFRDMHV